MLEERRFSAMPSNVLRRRLSAFEVPSAESSGPTVSGDLDVLRRLEVVTLGAAGVSRFGADALARSNVAHPFEFLRDLRRTGIGNVDRQACREASVTRDPCKAVAGTNVKRPKRITS